MIKQTTVKKVHTEVNEKIINHLLSRGYEFWDGDTIGETSEWFQVLKKDPDCKFELIFFATADESKVDMTLANIIIEGQKYNHEQHREKFRLWYDILILFRQSFPDFKLNLTIEDEEYEHSFTPVGMK